MKPGATTRFVASTVVARRATGQLADRGDAVAGDADVAAKPRRTGAVDDAAAGNQQVEGADPPARPAAQALRAQGPGTPRTH